MDTMNGESRGTAYVFPIFENQWKLISSQKKINCLPL